MKPTPALLAASILLVSPLAQAGHPLVSETPDALESGSCQVEFQQARVKARDTAAETGSDLQFSCGLGLRSQVAIGTTSVRSAGERSDSYRLVGKTALFAAEDGQTGVGLRYGASWLQTPGANTEWVDSTVLLVVTREVANGVLAHANLGLRRDRVLRQSTRLWSVGVESTDTLSFAADLFGEQRDKPWASVGAGWRPSKDSLISVAYALQHGESKAKAVSLGLSMLF